MNLKGISDPKQVDF